MDVTAVLTLSASARSRAPASPMLLSAPACARARPSATMRHAPACVLQCVCVHAALVNTSSQHAAGSQGHFSVCRGHSTGGRAGPRPRAGTQLPGRVSRRSRGPRHTPRQSSSSAPKRPHLHRRSAQQEALHHHTAPHAQRTLRHPRPTARAPHQLTHTHAPVVPRAACPTCACTVPRPPGTETAHHTVHPRVQRHPPLRAHPSTAGGRPPEPPVLPLTARPRAHTRAQAAACPPPPPPSPAHHPRSPPAPPAGAGTDVPPRSMDVTAVLTLSASARSHTPASPILLSAPACARARTRQQPCAMRQHVCCTVCASMMRV